MDLVKVSLFERSIIVMRAITDGLATTALLSACYWYTITPVAPENLANLCRNGACLKSIAILSTLAIIIAIPISYVRYQEIRKNTIHLCHRLFKASLIYKRNFKKTFTSSHTGSRIFARDNTWFNLQAMITGFMSALTIIGVSLSILWTYSSLIISAKVIDNIGFGTWEVIAIACITIGSMLGCAIGLVKQKDMCRKELIKQMNYANRSTSSLYHTNSGKPMFVLKQTHSREIASAKKLLK